MSTWGLYSALMVVEQWEFLNVPHILWQGTSVYKRNLLVLVTPTPTCKLPVLTTKVGRDWDSNSCTQPSACGGANVWTDYATPTVWYIYIVKLSPKRHQYNWYLTELEPLTTGKTIIGVQSPSFLFRRFFAECVGCHSSFVRSMIHKNDKWHLTLTLIYYLHTYNVCDTCFLRE